MVLILILDGCATPSISVPRKIITSGFNFSEYSNKGFLFTPNTYDGDYESIGLIQLIMTPDARIKNVYTGETSQTGEAIKKKKWVVEEIDPNKGIEEMYNLCIEMKADALTQMEFEPYLESHAQGTIMPVTISGIKISGFAIKRLGAFK